MLVRYITEQMVIGISPERDSGPLGRMGTLVLALLGLYPQYSALRTILIGLRGDQVPTRTTGQE